jgi:NADH pyrophosphatase NudC (nudix superfamily)
MEMWAWLAAYVLGFVLLQVYLYRYFVTGNSTTESVTPDSPGEQGVRPVEGTARRTEPPDGDEEYLRCESCGAYNENHQMFRFCGECGTELR